MTKYEDQNGILEDIIRMCLNERTRDEGLSAICENQASIEDSALTLWQYPGFLLFVIMDLTAPMQVFGRPDILRPKSERAMKVLVIVKLWAKNPKTAPLLMESELLNILMVYFNLSVNSSLLETLRLMCLSVFSVLLSSENKAIINQIVKTDLFYWSLNLLESNNDSVVISATEVLTYITMNDEGLKHISRQWNRTEILIQSLCKLLSSPLISHERVIKNCIVCLARFEGNDAALTLISKNLPQYANGNDDSLAFYPYEDASITTLSSSLGQLLYNFNKETKR